MTEESTDGLSKSLLEYLEQSTSYDSSSNFSAYEGTYTQVQDQFDPKNQNSFAQRFTVHAKNYKAGAKNPSRDLLELIDRQSFTD